MKLMDLIDRNSSHELDPSEMIVIMLENALAKIDELEDQRKKDVRAVEKMAGTLDMILSRANIAEKEFLDQDVVIINSWYPKDDGYEEMMELVKGYKCHDPEEDV